MTFSIVKSTAWWAKPQNQLKAIEVQPRSKRKLAGSHIHDLVGLGKAITLCKKCQGKFNAAINGYEQMREVTGFDYCYSKCNDCYTFGECNTYLKLRG